MNRTAIREQAFKLIYSLEIQKQDDLEETIELYEQSVLKEFGYIVETEEMRK